VAQPPPLRGCDIVTVTAPVRLVHLATTDMSLDWLLGPQLRAFADAGYEVIGLSAPGPHVASLQAAGIEHVALEHATRSFDLRADARALRGLVSVLRELAPTIVHTHNPKPGVYGRVAGRIARVPIVVNTQHGLYATPDDKLARRLAVYGLERLAASCSHAELVQNPEDLELLAKLRVPRSRLVQLGNGIDLERFDPQGVDAECCKAIRAQLDVRDDTVVCGVVGRLVGEKGYRELFEAARRLREREVPVTLVVVGPEDPDKGDAITPEEIAGAEEVGVRFLGRRDDMVELYSAFDMYVLASHREGFPRSAMEAAAMGLAVVATDVRGCRQVVAHDQTGLLVAARDSIALAGAIEALARNPRRREEMGRAAAALARDEFDQRQVIDITLATYDRLLAERRRSDSSA